jgi:hypothetical protein
MNLFSGACDILGSAIQFPREKWILESLTTLRPWVHLRVKNFRLSGLSHGAKVAI